MFKNRQFKRFLSLMLTLLMIVSLIPPMSVVAEEEAVYFTIDIGDTSSNPDGPKAKYYQFYGGGNEKNSYREENFEHNITETSKISLALESYDQENYTFLGWSIDGNEPIQTTDNKTPSALTDDPAINMAALGGSYISLRNGAPKESALKAVLPNIVSELKVVIKSNNIPKPHTFKPIFKSNKSESATYDLIVKSTEGGQGSKIPVDGDRWELQASANSGYEFIGWRKGESGEIVSSDNPYHITLDEDTTFTAVFEKAKIKLLEELIVSRSINDKGFVSGAINDGPASIGQRVAFNVPYSATAIVPRSSTVSLKVYAGSEATGEPIGIFSGNTSSELRPENRSNAAIIVDPMSNIQQVTVWAQLLDSEPVTKTYSVVVAPSVPKHLTYLTTPKDKVIASTAALDKGPDIYDIAPFIDETTGELSLYAAGVGGVFQLEGTAFKLMDGIDLAMGDNEGSTGMVYTVGGTKDHMWAVVKETIKVETTSKISYSLYEYTPQQGIWTQIEGSAIPDNIKISADKPMGLVINAQDIWTENAHWNGSSWESHSYNFTSFKKWNDEIAYASTDKGLYKYENGSWESFGSVTGTLTIQNINIYGELTVRGSGKDFYRMSATGAVTDIQGLSELALNTTPTISVDNNGDLYAFVETRLYTATGAGGHRAKSVYQQDVSTNEWILQDIANFNDPDDLAFLQQGVLDKKVRPTSVDTIYTPTVNMNLFVGRSGAVYADFGQTTITFDSNGGNEVAPLTQEIARNVQAPSAPTKDGESFIGWYIDAELTLPYTFSSMPAKDITLYAKWSNEALDLTATKEQAKEALNTAFASYKEYKYEADNWAALKAEKEAGLAAIEAVTTAQDDITAALNHAKNAMQTIPQKSGVTVAVTMEKFTLGQGYIIEPTLITIPKYTQASFVITDLINAKYSGIAKPYEMTGKLGDSFYLAHVYDTDKNYNIPQYIIDAITSSGKDFEPINPDDYLGEFDFYYMSGWMYAVNNKFPGVGAAAWILEDGQVMRWQYTLYGYGADLNADNEEWGTSSLIKTAVKDQLTWRVAEINSMSEKEAFLQANNHQEKYDQALQVLMNMESTQEEVDTALVALTEGEPPVEEKPPVEGGMPAEAKAVQDAINALSSPITLADKATVQAVRAAYDALGPILQQWIWKDTLSILTSAEATITRLEGTGALNDVQAVIAKIAALPENITLEHKKQIEEARAAYMALSNIQKEMVTNLMQLLTAEAKLANATGNTAAVNAVITKINALPTTIAITTKTAIEAARAAYNTLSSAEKGLVTNLAKLLTAESKLATLTNGKATAVIAQINALPTTITLTNKTAIEAARTAYNALSATEKALVTNLTKLTSAENTLKLLQAKDDAKLELDRYKKASDYRTKQQVELTEAIAAAKKSIDAATTTAGITSAVSNAKTTIDKIKTDAQLTKEEKGEREDDTVKTEVKDKDIAAQIKDKTIKRVEIATQNISMKQSQVRAELSASLLKDIADAGKPLVIKTGAIEMEIPARVIKSIAKSVTGKTYFTVRLAEDADVPRRSDALSDTYELVITTEIDKIVTAITTFAEPVIVSIPVPRSDVRDQDKVTAFYVDEETGELYFMISNYSKGVLTFKTNQLGQFVVVENNKTFEDITSSWAKDYIESLASKTIIKGRTESQFAPNEAITRAQFAVILTRMLNLPKETYEGIFSDVSRSMDWSVYEIEAANRAGIVFGSNGSFNPNEQITREQMATMIVRAMEYVDYSIIEDVTGTVKFADGSSIASYAKENVEIASSLGIISGRTVKGQQYFAPQENATRAQAAKMLFNMLENF